MNVNVVVESFGVALKAVDGDFGILSRQRPMVLQMKFVSHLRIRVRAELCPFRDGLPEHYEFI